MALLVFILFYFYFNKSNTKRERGNAMDDMIEGSNRNPKLLTSHRTPHHATSRVKK
jgi:hypothetical protein